MQQGAHFFKSAAQKSLLQVNNTAQHVFAPDVDFSG